MGNNHVAETTDACETAGNAAEPSQKATKAAEHAASTPAPTEHTSTLVVDLETPAHGGSVITRVDGQIMFIRGGLPGERHVTVKLDQQKKPRRSKGFRTGHAVEVGIPSPHRIPAQCPAALAGAGCCDLDFVDAAGSLEFKQAVVTDQLRRIAGIDRSSIDHYETHSLAPHTHWRTRVRLGVDSHGRAGLRFANSHTILPLGHATCAQWATGLVEGVDTLRLTPGAQLAIAMGDTGDEAYPLSNSPGTVRGIIELTGSRFTPHRRIIEGTGQIPHRILTPEPVTWNLPVDAFWQGHRAAAQFYVDWIRRIIPSGQGVAWDLYGGAGVFAAALADKADVVDSVDQTSAVSTAGRRALAHLTTPTDGSCTHPAPRIRFIGGGVQHKLGGLRTRGGVHAVVLDPPRTGVGVGIIERIAAAQPRHVIHIGCDPATAARDLAVWTSSGYQIEKLAVIDAFPLTHHVEILAYLRPTTTRRTREEQERQAPTQPPSHSAAQPSSHSTDEKEKRRKRIS